MDKLEYVLTLAEERNLTRAASRLFISQPTLTNYINRLEDELGIKLFDRTVQPIQVTEAGLIYIEDKKKIQDRELTLRSKLDSLKQKKRTFTIGMPPVRAASELPRVLPRFLKKYPGLDITVDNRLEEDLEKDVAAGRVDVAIGMLSMAYSTIQYECLHEDPVFLVLPRSADCVSHLTAEEGTIENPWLLDGNCLSSMTMLLPCTGGGHYRLTMQMVERYNIVPQNEIRSSSMNLLYQLVGEGAGFLLVTAEIFRKAYPQYTDRLAFCTLRQERQIQKTYAGWLPDSPKQRMIEDFVALVKRE